MVGLVVLRSEYGSDQEDIEVEVKVESLQLMPMLLKPYYTTES